MPLLAKPIMTQYWRPGDDFLDIIARSVSGFCEEGDIVVISEKAVSVAIGGIVDESRVYPTVSARILARFWMRLVWGYILGPLCHMSRKTLSRMRQYPIPEGEAHKEVTLRYAGFFQSLLHYSEGGIDVTNLPFSLAALPISNAGEVAAVISQAITERCKANVTVMITDTDKTYSRQGKHLTPRPNAIPGIKPLGLFAVIIGRTLRWTARASPLAICGRFLDIESALSIADAADRARGFGAGRTAWDMAKRFHVGLAGVTWEMLDRVQHYPVVVVKNV